LILDAANNLAINLSFFTADKLDQNNNLWDFNAKFLYWFGITLANFTPTVLVAFEF
jgi:hypothetical protein